MIKFPFTLTKKVDDSVKSYGFGIVDVQGFSSMAVTPLENNMSNEKNPGWLGSTGVILPGYIGSIIHHYKDPYYRNWLADC